LRTKYLSTVAFSIPEEPIVTTATLPSRSITRSRSKFRSKLLAKDFNRPVLSKRKPTHYFLWNLNRYREKHRNLLERK